MRACYLSTTYPLASMVTTTSCKSMSEDHLFCTFSLLLAISRTMLLQQLRSAVCCCRLYSVSSATHNLWLGLLGSALATVSGLHLYMIAEFINTLGALTFLVWSGWFSIRWVQTRALKWIGLAVIFLAAAVFSHQLAIGIVLVVAVCLFLFKGLVSSKSEGRYAFAALIVLVAIYFAPALLKAQGVIDIPER